MTIEEIESRFKELTDLTYMDLSKSPIKKSDYEDQQQKTSKELSKQFGFVATPIFLVDIMIYMKYKEINKDTKTCDLCAGYGQFTIRLMRMLYNRLKINVEEWLENSHTLTELQMPSCAKLVYIFGPNINLYAGDSLKLEYTDENDKGILFFDEKNKKWVHNELVDNLIHQKIVYSNLKLLLFIFDNINNNDKLSKLIEKLKNYK